MLTLTLQSHFIRGIYRGRMYALSPDSGWMDSKIFYEWFEHHFFEYPPSGRTLLLLLDSHSSHYNPTFIYYAAQKGVMMSNL